MAFEITPEMIELFKFWTIIICIVIVVLLIVFVIAYYKSFNMKCWVFERRGTKFIKQKTLMVKRLVENGITKYQVWSWNFFSPKKTIKPTNCAEDIFQDEKGRDMLMVAKGSNEEYCHIQYNSNSMAFEDIPAEVNFWASVTTRERELVHKTGMNWGAIASMGLVFIALIISLLMVMYVLDYAETMRTACQTAQAVAPVVGANLPIVGDVVN